MEVEFKGLELDTPVGGIAVGRGYSGIAGEDYFRGLAIQLPVGRLRAGWRAWKQAEETRPDLSRAFVRWVHHLMTFAWIVTTVFVFDRFVGPGQLFVPWIAGIWGAILIGILVETVAVPYLTERIQDIAQ